jgi:hypothetical protein
MKMKIPKLVNPLRTEVMRLIFPVIYQNGDYFVYAITGMYILHMPYNGYNSEIPFEDEREAIDKCDKYATEAEERMK